MKYYQNWKFKKGKITDSMNHKKIRDYHERLD